MNITVYLGANQGNDRCRQELCANLFAGSAE